MMKPLTSIRSATAMRLLCAAALASVSLQTFAAGESCVTRSAAARVTVLELYTSEGCNSCPPADRWVSSLPAKGFTPDRVIHSRSTWIIGTSSVGQTGWRKHNLAAASVCRPSADARTCCIHRNCS